MTTTPVSPFESMPADAVLTAGRHTGDTLGPRNPYVFEEAEVQVTLQRIVSERVPYIDSRTNPDISSLAVYLLNGEDPDSDAARAEEGKVFGAEWGLPPEATQADFATFEGNSDFFLLLDKSNADDIRIVAALRVADCMQGPSETIGFFHESFGQDTPLPQEMQPDKVSQTLWDIVGVVADPDYRDGRHTPWLYHALYRRSLEEGVTRWISNVTPQEMRNLRDFIGIPFVDIPGVETAEYTSPVDGKVTEFNFYSIEVDTIFEGVSGKILDLEKNPSSGINNLIARLARIALLGDVTQLAGEETQVENKTAVV